MAAMRTIRPHTRKERRNLVELLTPRIQERFGERLLALATWASVARSEDGPYSDLELLAIVTDGPKGGNSIIHDGMLIELEWMTEAGFLAACREVTDEWYLAGSSRLAPIINAELIESLNLQAAPGLESKCLDQARRQWFEVQEATAKVLNAIEAGNRDGLGLVAWDMLRHMLIALSLLNAMPYATFARMITQARELPTQPESLGDLLDLMVEGAFGETRRLRDAAVATFEQLESLYSSRGVPLGIEELDALI